MSEYKINKLIKVIDDIKLMNSVNNEKAFKILLNYLAFVYGIDGVVFKSTPETHEYLESTVDTEIIKEHGRDLLGELYVNLGLYPKNKPDLIPYKDIEVFSIGYNKKDRKFPTTYIDRSCGTGRALVACYNELKGNVLLYGIEENRDLYKITLVNLAANGIPAKIILQPPKVNIENISPVDFEAFRSSHWGLTKEKMIKILKVSDDN